MNDIKDILLELETGFWQAAGGDGSYYEENFADDGKMILPFKGGILGKSQTIETVKQAEPWANFHIKNPELMTMAESMIALLYEGYGERTQGKPYTALICSVYRMRNNTWQLVTHQQTPLANIGKS